MHEWVAVWEEFFNLGAGEVPCDSSCQGVINYDYSACCDINALFQLEDRKRELQNTIKALTPEFRRKYYLNKSPRATDEVTVAVHIRRGDVSADQVANAVKAILRSHQAPFAMRIYAQGTA